MAIRAKYVGPHDAVVVSLPNQQEVEVVRNGLLPLESPDGSEVPIDIRDGLLEQSDVWSKVQQKTDSQKKED